MPEAPLYHLMETSTGMSPFLGDAGASGMPDIGTIERVVTGNILGVVFLAIAIIYFVRREKRTEERYIAERAAREKAFKDEREALEKRLDDQREAFEKREDQRWLYIREIIDLHHKAEKEQRDAAIETLKENSDDNRKVLAELISSMNTMTLAVRSMENETRGMAQAVAKCGLGGK